MSLGLFSAKDVATEAAIRHATSPEQEKKEDWIQHRCGGHLFALAALLSLRKKKEKTQQIAKTCFVQESLALFRIAQG